jgi:hypothetical protein
MWKTWKGRPLWESGASKPRDPCGCGHASHKTHRLFTGVFGRSVEDVGKIGQVISFFEPFSIFPEFHSPVLEMWTGIQTTPHEQLGMDIHFSCGNYGEYGKRLRLTHGKRPGRRTASCQPGSCVRSPWPSLVPAGMVAPPPDERRIQPVFPRFHAGFPRPSQMRKMRKHEYNQEQAGTAVSAMRLGDVQCGQREAAWNAGRLP